MESKINNRESSTLVMSIQTKQEKKRIKELLYFKLCEKKLIEIVECGATTTIFICYKYKQNSVYL